MSDANKPLNQKHAKKLKKGWGEGIGKNYKPFSTVRDFASKGISNRYKGIKTQRIHQFHSDLERDAFLIFDRSQRVIDIREQFPIPLQDSLIICQELGIRHPQEKGELFIVTTDFVVNTLEQNQYCIAVKYAKDLKKKRVIEKLQIEKYYWEKRGCHWSIFTEHQISRETKANLRWIRSYVKATTPELEHSISPKDCQRFLSRLESVAKNLAISKLCGRFDKECEMKPGYNIDIFCYLVAFNYISGPIKKVFHDWTIADIKIHSMPYELGDRADAS